MFRTRRPWVAHTLGIAAAALLWVIANHFWGDNYTWWAGPLILTWPTYHWTKNLTLLGMPERQPEVGEYVPYDPYHPATTGRYVSPDPDMSDVED